MKKTARFRSILVTLMFAIGFTIVSCRLIELQLVKHRYFRDEAIKMHYVGVPIPPKRGNILDRNGRVLAQTVSVTDLRLDGQLWQKYEKHADAVAEILGISKAEFTQKIDVKNRFQLIAENISEDALIKLKALKARPLVFVERMMRVYPNGSEASHLIGLVNLHQVVTPMVGNRVEFEVGVEGMEKTMDRFLRGVPGERRVVRDASRREIAAYRQADRPPQNGQDVILTIDQVVQHLVEEEADRLVRDYQPENLHIIVTRPDTGEILALANRPSFDPNDRSTVLPENLRNAAISNIYEPGSTFKAVTLAAALNEGVVDLDTPIFCENGRFFYAGRWLTDHTASSTLAVREVLAKSSNIGFAKIAMLLGNETIYQYAKIFGFGARALSPQTSLSGEENGVLRPVKQWSKLSITRIPMGYEVAVTNLQMCMAYGAIANGGRLMEPRMVKSVVDSSGNAVSEYMPKILRQVMRPQTAVQLAQAMKSVVSDEGTAVKAAVDGFDVAGKTGTAQKLVNGVYDRQNYIASFIGFMPANKPEFLVSIVVDSPKGGAYYGGQVSAPAFSRIASQVAQQLGLVRSDATTALLVKQEETL